MSAIKADGYSLEKYEDISRKSKQFLPNRCPIVLDCERAKGTRWLFVQRMEKSSMFFEYELTEDENYTLNPKLFRIFQNTYPKEFLTEVSNACPEVIFENFGLFAGYYKHYEDYDMEGKIIVKTLNTEGKHFSQCNEFAHWLFKNTSFAPSSSKKRKHIFSEMDVEDYLVNNLQILENGLVYIDRQVRIETGRVDIVAKDYSGNKVLVEIKAKPLKPKDIHEICGQVCTYFNEIKQENLNARFFVVILKEENQNHLFKLWNGLRHLFQDNKVVIIQFERKLTGGYIFSTVNYLD
ncbi:MAG: endonuclease NucS [Candidatus Scalindua sp.]|nr:endonuclease NucS [Candidatus Scalindua sp.]